MFTSDDQPGWSMDSKPIRHPSSAKKMKCSFIDYIHFWWSAWLVDGLEPHLPSLSSQKMKCSFLDYIQLLMIGRAGQWTWIPSAIPLQPKNEMLVFGLHSTSDNQPGWFMDSNPILHPSPAKKMKCLFLDYAQLLMISLAGRWTQTPSATSLQPKKNEMLIFGLHSTSDDQPGWSMDSNPICHPSPAKKWNACFWIMFSFWWSAWLVDGLEPHLPPLHSQKMKCLFLDYV